MPKIISDGCITQTQAWATFSIKLSQNKEVNKLKGIILTMENITTPLGAVGWAQIRLNGHWVTVIPVEIFDDYQQLVWLNTEDWDMTNIDEVRFYFSSNTATDWGKGMVLYE